MAGRMEEAGDGYLCSQQASGSKLKIVCELVDSEVTGSEEVSLRSVGARL